MRRLVLLCALITSAAHAASVRLVDAQGTIVPLNGELVSHDATFAVKNGIADVALLPGTTIDVELHSVGWWALPATIPSDGAQMRVWRTGTLTGRAIAAKDVVLPSLFTAYVESPPQPAKTPPIPRGTKFDCPIGADGIFVCELPAETLDLALRAKGLTPHYRWDVVLQPQQKLDLGTITWKRGASLVVWLDRESAKAAKKGAIATLTHMTAGQTTSTAAHLSVPSAESKFNERGYAQLAPLEAGTFVLQISAAGFSTAKLSPIEIYEGSESVLRKPIVLEPPIDVHVAITPPLDPEGNRWHVTFFRVADPASPVSGSSHALVADEHGQFVVSGESPGRFSVRVSDKNENRVAWKDFDVQSGADAYQSITIEQHLIHGTVTLGDTPLECDLVFGMRHGVERVSMHANAEGKFTGALPRLGSWPVEIRSDAEKVNVLRRIEVAKDEQLEIRLADTLIAGEVLDRDGSPLPRASVILAINGVSQSYEADAAGAFRFRGYTGRVALQGQSRRTSEESPIVAIDVVDGQQISDVKLHLAARNDVRGRVTLSGQPLPGASVSVYPGNGSVPRTTTDRDGRFQVTLREGITNATFVIAAAGRTMAAFQRPLSKEELTFDLDSVGGDLIVHLPESSDRFTIFHNGARLGMQELFEWASAHGRELIQNRETVAAPDLARGLYRACAHLVSGNEVCKESMLVPRGSVTIDLR